MFIGAASLTDNTDKFQLRMRQILFLLQRET